MLCGLQNLLLSKSIDKHMNCPSTLVESTFRSGVHYWVYQASKLETTLGCVAEEPSPRDKKRATDCHERLVAMNVEGAAMKVRCSCIPVIAVSGLAKASLSNILECTPASGHTVRSVRGVPMNATSGWPLHI